MGEVVVLSQVSRSKEPKPKQEDHRKPCHRVFIALESRPAASAWESMFQLPGYKLQIPTKRLEASTPDHYALAALLAIVRENAQKQGWVLKVRNCTDEDSAKLGILPEEIEE